MRALILAAALLSSTAAIASTDPVKDTRQIMAGTVKTQSVKNAYLSGARDTTVEFQGALAAYKAVRAAEPKLAVKCLDGTLVQAPGVCPAPVPTPTPTPTPTPSPVTWTKCATGDSGQICNIVGTANVRYGANGAFITKAVTTSISCDWVTFGGDPLFGVPKNCETDGTVAGAPAPTPAPTPTPVPSSGWVASGPVAVGGFAYLANGGPCCNGLVVKVLSVDKTSDARPVNRWFVQAYADPSGNFDFARYPNFTGYNFDGGLIGVVPKP